MGSWEGAASPPHQLRGSGSAVSSQRGSDQNPDRPKVFHYFQHSWWPLLLIGPHCIFMNSFETTRLPGHFDLLPLHCFTDYLCHRLRLSGVLLLCASSLELSRDIHKIGSFRRCLKSELFAAAYGTYRLDITIPSALLIRLATRRYTNLSGIV